MAQYCNCGREIKVRMRGKWVTPHADHTECRQCYRSSRDWLRRN
jgi:hypothetical protein